MPNTMHSFESNTSNVPAFLVKLWKLVEDPSCNDLIAWSDNGSSFIIRDQTRFSKDLLPQYFKHNNMASFIRQLNMYGFRKVINYEKSGLRNENDEMEFQHTFFCKGQGGLLELIKRKIPNTKVTVTEPAVKSNARDILTDLSSIREKQENMDNMLLKMKQENELLWRELTSMRQKHKAQEQIIQKVIQFLVSIVQRGNQNIGVQRMPRMLHDSSRNKENKVARTIDVLRSKSPNYITVSPDKIVSPLGPVIHEVTDFDHDQEENTLSPKVNSPNENTEASVSENDNQESECPLNSSLNSPINTSVTMEPLSILEPLQPSTPTLNSDECTVDESILGIPLEYINAPPSEVMITENVVSLPEASTNTSLSYTLSPPSMLVYSPSKSEFDDNLLSESLNTPKIPTIHIEDACPSPTAEKEENKTTKKGNEDSKTIQNEHSYQLALTDTSSNSLKSSQSLTNEKKRCPNYIPNSEMRFHSSLPTLERRNTLSNHLLNVEEELNWLQNQITSNAWNIDANKLLGLFSTDDTANNETLAGEIAAETNIKREVNDIVGNELVQFAPSMLECELDIGTNQFLECLNQDAEVPTGDNSKNSQDQKNFLLVDVLNAANQEAASEAAEYLLSNGSSAKLKTPRRSKIQKLPKAKRRKVK